MESSELIRQGDFQNILKKLSGAFPHDDGVASGNLDGERRGLDPPHESG